MRVRRVFYHILTLEISIIRRKRDSGLGTIGEYPIYIPSQSLLTFPGRYSATCLRCLPGPPLLFQNPSLYSYLFLSIERVLHSILTQRLLFALKRAGSEPELDESEKLESMKFDDGPMGLSTVDTEAGIAISSFNSD